MCIDYSALNANTIIDAYPIPHIDDILDHLGGSIIFSKIDSSLDYHQVWIAKGYEHRTAFHTCCGLFRYHVLLFGLCNTPTTLQRLMLKIFQANLDVFCIVHLDAILIFLRSAAAHEQHLHWVLQ